jgi:hypothetical protein
VTPKRKRTTDAVGILHRRYYAGRPEWLAALEEERANADVARQICALREKAGLTQAQVAKLIGTTHRSSAVWRMPTTKAIRSPCCGASRRRYKAGSKSALCH